MYHSMRIIQHLTKVVAELNEKKARIIYCTCTGTSVAFAQGCRVLSKGEG